MFLKEIFSSGLMKTLDSKKTIADELESRLVGWGVAPEEARRRRAHEELHAIADTGSGVFVVNRLSLGPLVGGPYVPEYIAVGYRTPEEVIAIATAVGSENMSNSDKSTLKRAKKLLAKGRANSFEIRF